MKKWQGYFIGFLSLYIIPNNKQPKYKLIMTKTAISIPENIDTNDILNKARIVKCMTQVKLLINDSEKQKLVDGDDSKIDR